MLSQAILRSWPCTLKGKRCLGLTRCPLPSVKPVALLLKSTSASPFFSISFPYQWNLDSRLIKNEDLFRSPDLVLISPLHSQSSIVLCSAIDQHFQLPSLRRQAMWWNGHHVGEIPEKETTWLVVTGQKRPGEERCSLRPLPIPKNRP